MAKKKDAAENTEATVKEVPKYPALSGTFMRGKFPGQLKSAHKDREANPAKAADFVKALAAGDIVFPAEGCTPQEASKLKDLGLELDAQYIRSPARAPKAEAAEGEAEATETAEAAE